MGVRLGDEAYRATIYKQPPPHPAQIPGAQFTKVLSVSPRCSLRRSREVARRSREIVMRGVAPWNLLPTFSSVLFSFLVRRVRAPSRYAHVARRVWGVPRRREHFRLGERAMAQDPGSDLLGAGVGMDSVTQGTSASSVAQGFHPTVAFRLLITTTVIINQGV